MFKSRYFKNKPVTVDQMSNGASLMNYVKWARKDAKADFFAIGTSVITDNGFNPNIGRCVCSGMTAVKVYSTHDGEVIASGSITESAAGDSPDQCRAAAADKIGQGLGQTLASKVQNYWKKRQMYGSEFVVLIKGNFAPMERITLNKTLKNIQGVANATLRTTEPGRCEFIVTYKGMDSLSDVIFMSLAESSLAGRFAKYDYDINGNQITYAPIAPPAAKK